MLILTSLLLLAQAAPAPQAPPARRPNFVFVLGEGHGWSSTSVDMDGRDPSHARPVGLTPNLEQLAAEGLRFSDFYATAPRCTPSRASFLTGISPAKLHMTYVNEGGREKRGEAPAETRVTPPTPLTELPDGVRTIGDALREAGYATAHFGKWHVGRSDPTRHGFDRSDGANTNQGPERGVEPNPAQSLAITERGIEFIKARVAARQPFYLQLSHYGVGSEAEVTPESLAEASALLPKQSGKALAAAAGVRDMDKSIGRLLVALKELGVDGDTFVFFSTDHGSPGGGGGGPRASAANPPFRGGKGSVSEGGLRVPFIVRGPGVPAGAVCPLRASGMDLLPTLRELAGAPLAKPAEPNALASVEGDSLAPLLRAGSDGKLARARDEFVVHFPHYDLDNGGPASAIFVGKLKLVRNYDTQRVSLFDVVADPTESTDLASAEPEQIQALEARLDAYLKAVQAQMPSAGAATGAAPPPERREKRDKRSERDGE